MRIRDIDPNKAPTKTAQDLLDTFLMFGKINDRKDFGFTVGELPAGLRTDYMRTPLLLAAGVHSGHLRLDSGRYFIEPSMYRVSYVELMGPALIRIERHPSCDNRAKKCFGSGGECWRHNCSWCNVSSTHWATEADAHAQLQGKRKDHAGRISHSLSRSAVRT